MHHLGTGTGIRMEQHKHDRHHEDAPQFGTHVFGKRMCAKLDLLYVRYIKLIMRFWVITLINFVTVKFPGIIWIWSTRIWPKWIFFQIWNICLYPSWQVNYTVNIPCGYPIIRYRVFRFRWSWGWSVVKVCNGFCFFLFNIFLIFLKRIWLTCSIFFFQRISDPVQSQFQIWFITNLIPEKYFCVESNFERICQHCITVIPWPERWSWGRSKCNT